MLRQRSCRSARLQRDLARYDGPDPYKVFGHPVPGFLGRSYLVGSLKVRISVNVGNKAAPVYFIKVRLFVKSHGRRQASKSGKVSSYVKQIAAT